MKEDFDIENVIRRLCKKNKSLPIRRANKSPVLLDIQNSITRAMTDRVGSSVRNEEKLNSQLAKLPQQLGVKSKAIATTQLVTSWRLTDGVIHSSTLKSSMPKPQSVNVNEIDTTHPLRVITGGRPEASPSLSTEEECLLDMLQEESESYFSNWVHSSAAVSDHITPPPLTTIQRAAGASEILEPWPVLQGRMPLGVQWIDNKDGRHHLAKQRAPGRLFVPLSKAKKHSKRTLNA